MTGGRSSLSRFSVVLLLALIGIPLLLRDRGLRPPPPARSGEATRAPAERGLVFTAGVVQAIDGDTLRIAGGERIRLLAVDAPEHDSPLFSEARQACRDLAEGREARFEATSIPPRDHYGRLLALVHVGDILLNEELLARGLACVYLKRPEEIPAEVERRLIKAQNAAIDRRRGLWSRPEALSTRPGESLVATRFRFHRSGCPSLSAEGGPRVPPRPTTREEALRSGRSACRNCKPRVPRRRAAGHPGELASSKPPPQDRIRRRP